MDMVLTLEHTLLKKNNNNTQKRINLLIITMTQKNNNDAITNDVDRRGTIPTTKTIRRVMMESFAK